MNFPDRPAPLPAGTLGDAPTIAWVTAWIQESV